MERLRDSLTAGFLKKIENELGREATLRLLWPHIVGSPLAANTQLKSIRGSTLIVAVPDRSWQTTLRSLDSMILDAVNRWVGEGTYDVIEFPEQPRMARQRNRNRERSMNKKPEPGNRQAGEFCASAVKLETGMIADESLRKSFLESAKKYFGTQGEPVSDPAVGTLPNTGGDTTPAHRNVLETPVNGCPGVSGNEDWRK